MKKEELHKMYPWLTAGIECGDGWLPLISALCSRLQWYCAQNKIDLPTVKQVKEKFGSLCFYVDMPKCKESSKKEMYCIIGDYEAMSRFVCEECGTTVGVGWCNGWIRSICEPCFEKVIKPRWPERTWKTRAEPISGIDTMEPIVKQKE